MLRARLLTAAVAVPPLVWLVCCAPGWLFAAVLLLFTALGLYEYFVLARPHNPLPPALGWCWGMAVACALLSAQPWLTGAVLALGLFLTFCVTLRNFQPEWAVVGVSHTLLGVVYIGFLLPHFIVLRWGPEGPAWVFFVMFVAMIGDTAGYAVGRVWGTHKLIPAVSPGKTIEGSIGATLGNLCAAGAAWLWLFPHRAPLEMLGLGLGVGILAQIGDLCESALKRAFGTKDSGGLFPGHGGMLDRIDSLLFPAAFIYYYITLWN